MRGRGSFNVQSLGFEGKEGGKGYNSYGMRDGKGKGKGRQ